MCEEPPSQPNLILSDLDRFGLNCGSLGFMEFGKITQFLLCFKTSFLKISVVSTIVAPGGSTFARSFEVAEMLF